MYIPNAAIALIERRTQFLTVKSWDVRSGPSTMMARTPLNTAQIWQVSSNKKKEILEQIETTLLILADYQSSLIVQNWLWKRPPRHRKKSR